MFNDKTKFWIKSFLVVGVMAYFILMSVFVRFSDDDLNNYGMKIYIPWGFIAIFISFYLFREFNRTRTAKRDGRREQLNQRRQELLDNVIKSKNKKAENPEE